MHWPPSGWAGGIGGAAALAAVWVCSAIALCLCLRVHVPAGVRLVGGARAPSAVGAHT